MRNLFVLVITWLLVGSCNSPLPLKFIHFRPLNVKEDLLIDGKVYRQDFCIVENYKRNAMNEKMIDSMANALYKIYKPKYFSYQLAVYKYSDYTNPTHLTEYPRDLDRYSQDNDMIFTYRWLGNSPVNKWIWRKGEVISPKIDIIIEDAPPLPKQYLGISYGISQFPLCKRDRKIS